MAGTGYLIRTANGDRGPYSVEQIRAFANAGKLPLKARIRDVAATRTVSVQQVVDGSSKFAMVAAGTEDLATGDEAMSTPAPAPSRSSRTGSNRRTTRTVSRADGSTGRGTSRMSRKPATSSEHASGRGTSRVTRRARPSGGKSKAMGGILGTIGLILVIVVLKFALRGSLGPESIPSELRGRWELDIAATRVVNQDETIQPARLVLDFGSKELGITMDGQHEAGNIKVRSQNGSHFDLELPVKNDKSMVMTIDLEGGGRMRCVFAGATVILVRR